MRFCHFSMALFIIPMRLICRKFVRMEIFMKSRISISEANSSWSVNILIDKNISVARNWIKFIWYFEMMGGSGLEFLFNWVLSRLKCNVSLTNGQLQLYLLKPQFIYYALTKRLPTKRSILTNKEFNLIYFFSSYNTSLRWIQNCTGNNKAEAHHHNFASSWAILIRNIFRTVLSKHFVEL